VRTGIRFTQAATSLFAVGLLTAEVQEKARELIDGILNTTGSYVAEEGAYKFVLPREAATILMDDESLSPNAGLNSWFTFSSGVHREAILTGQFLLLADEVNPVLSAALDNGLEITGLADSTLFAGPRLYTMDFTGVGTFQGLATAVRKTLDQIQVVRTKNAGKSTSVLSPAFPKVSAITGPPLDTALAMRGVVTGGVYKAAIGRKGLLHGDPIGREMGMTTWLAFAGTDSHAVSTGDMLATLDELQDLLKALRMKGMFVTSIRNHTLGEHPQVVFVRFWGEGPALDLAKALRFVLEVQVGAASLKTGYE
jgi:Domain of Unknown Function (DUF1259)